MSKSANEQMIDECVDENSEITVALAGQPNVGKSTVFNILTGLNQHVGNWPGKTIEQKTGNFEYGDLKIHLVDLPGTYSLTANSPEEVIAREYIIREKPNVVIAVVNAASFERNLYLLAELLPLPAPVVLALNMLDVAKQEGIQIEGDVLQAALGIPVVPMTATQNKGIENLLETVYRLCMGEIEYNPKLPTIRQDHRDVLAEIEGLIANYVPEPYPVSWMALKLLEGDANAMEIVREHLPDTDWQRVYSILYEHEDAVVAIASGRYDWIERMSRAALVRHKLGQVTVTEMIDRWATHPFWGVVMLAATLGILFWVTYTVGAPIQELLDTYIIGGLSSWITIALAGSPEWIIGLLVDGIIGGAGMVVTFLPIMVIFYSALGILEDTGYMARAAYVMDRFMHMMGLHGKSSLPLIVGFGCNVPAVTGARIIESEKARLLTILLAPLVPCTARMVVVTFLTPLFFGPAATLVSWMLVGMSLGVLAISGILFSKFLFKGEYAAFIMELPLYHVPNVRTISLLVWQRTVEFVQKAGTVILVMSVIIWSLSVLPTGEIQTSFIAQIGRAFTPLGRLMGMDWRMIVALMTSFIAKENSLATLGVLYGAGEANRAQTLTANLTPAAALAFLVVQMLFVPCVATVGAVHQETKSWKWTIFGVGYLTLLSLVGGILTYQVVSLFYV